MGEPIYLSHKDGRKITLYGKNEAAAYVARGWQYAGAFTNHKGAEVEPLATKTETLIATELKPALIDATPTAVKLAEEHGIDLMAVTGTGENGRILVSDVRSWLNE